VKIKLLTISKEDMKEAHGLFDEYAERLKHYTAFEFLNLKPPKNSIAATQKKLEGEQLLRYINAEDHLVLLDEHGKGFSSEEFSLFISKKMIANVRCLCFAIGGAYGFDQTVYERSNQLISLSKMTLPHQLAKVVFTEQLYRAFTILRNEKYHLGGR
jgi:23S rRNA (pseudouridine1915-N3)-methyltransferase